jgi:hypothetical protein
MRGLGHLLVQARITLGKGAWKSGSHAFNIEAAFPPRLLY